LLYRYKLVRSAFFLRFIDLSWFPHRSNSTKCVFLLKLMVVNRLLLSSKCVSFVLCVISIEGSWLLLKVRWVRFVYPERSIFVSLLLYKYRLFRLMFLERSILESWLL
jgi:hypothetical protein